MTMEKRTPLLHTAMGDGSQLSLDLQEILIVGIILQLILNKRKQDQDREIRGVCAYLHCIHDDIAVIKI